MTPCGATESRRQVLYLGDYVSRGPDSAAVVDRVRGWLPDGFERVTLKGNHEDLLLRFLDGESQHGPSLARLWRARCPGLPAMALPLPTARPVTMPAWLHWAATLPRESRRPIWSSSVHCGSATERATIFLSMAACDPACLWRMQSDRDCLWIRKTFLNSDADHGAMVVHGHSISDQPEIRHNRIGIDTGAYRSGVLTCLVLAGATRNFLQTANP
jgi:serine/threonine protein phosphatase 1